MRLDLIVKQNLSFFLKNSKLSSKEKAIFVFLPRTFWQKEINLGNIKLQNKIVKPSISIDVSKIFFITFEWEKIKKNWADFYEKKLVPAKLNLEIIEESHDYIVVNKPANIVVHPAFPLKRDELRKPSLIEGVLNLYSEVGLVTEKGEEERPGIVHRLDKETSGALIIARNLKTKLFFKNQFKKRKIFKTYLALVEGEFPYKQFEISGLMGKLATNPLKRGIADLKINSHMFSLKRAAKILNPKNSLTKGEVISCGTLDNINKTNFVEDEVFKNWKTQLKSKGKFTLLRLFPHTGRTHQIRVHLSSVDFPIVGDKLYRSSIMPTNNFHCLHSYSLSWKDTTKNDHFIEARRVILS